MKSEWKVVYCNGYRKSPDGCIETEWKNGCGEGHNNRTRLYMIYRLKDINKADRNYNRDVYAYTRDKEKAQELLSRLNTYTEKRT